MTENDYNAAIASVQQAVEMNRQQNNLSGVTHHLGQLGLCYGKAGQSNKASGCFAESLDGYRSLKDLRGMAELFSEIADVFPISKESVLLLGAAETINVAVSARPKRNNELTSRCREALGDMAFQAAYSKGTELSTEQALEIAGTVLHQVGTTPAGSSATLR
jgi:hypothetical protein